MLLPPALAFLGAFVVAPHAAAQQPADPVRLAVELEMDVRGWALSLAGLGSEGGALDSELVTALQSPDWRARRAGLDAIGRAAAMVRGAQLEDWARAQIHSGLVDTHPNVQVAALFALDVFGGVLNARAEPLAELAGADMPSVRLGVTRVLTHGLATLNPTLSTLWSAEERAQSEQLLALRLQLFVGADKSGLLYDLDPEVRGAARQAFFVAELPAGGELGGVFRRERIELLFNLVVERKMEELSMLLGVIARTTPEPLFLEALSQWGTWIANERSQDLLAMGVLPVHFRGLVEATRSTAGADCDAALLVPAFADWILARPDSALEFNIWRTVDDLFSSGVRAGGEELARELMATATLPNVGIPTLETSSGGLIENNHPQEDVEEARRELLQALVDSNKPEAVLALGAELCMTEALAVNLIDQFPLGFDAAHLGAASKWATKNSNGRALALAVTEAISTHHTFHPSDASESFLLGVMDWDDYAALETAFKALCDARWSGAEQFGLHSNEDLFEGLFAGFDRIWKMSRGVRLDVLIKLPHVPEVVLFAPLLIEVGDAAGRTADYRGQCVELLGSCEGSELAADALTRWMHEELDLITSDGGDGPLTRAQELELSGYSRAFAGIGSSSSGSQESGAQENGQTLPARRQLGRGSLEILLELSRGRSDELGKHTVAALAKFDGGLEILAEEYLGETQSVDRRARIEAGIACVQGGVETKAAIAELIRDYGAIGWDLRDRVIRAIGYFEGQVSLQFLLGLIDKGLEEHDGLVTREELNSAIDVLAWRVSVGASPEGASEDIDLLAATAFDALTRVARFASNIESRGIAISRIGSMLRELRAAGVPRGDAGDAAFSCLESLSKSSDLLQTLAEDEVEYLMERSTLALAESLDGTPQPEWLQARVLEGPLQVAREDLVARWRGNDPGEREFTNRGSVDLWRALGDVASVIDGPTTGGWYGADGRLLGTMAHMIEGQEPELAARLYAAAVIALEGEPSLDREVWTETLGRQLGLAWRGGAWGLASNLVDRLVVARRRGALSDPGFRLVFGTRTAAQDIWPVARLESLRLQARARLAIARKDDPAAKLLIERAAELVGQSSAALADQGALSRE